MTSHIHGNKPIVIGQFRTHLSSPGEPTLRNAMDKYNWPSSRVALFSEVGRNAPPAGNHVTLHCIPPQRGGRPARRTPTGRIGCAACGRPATPDCAKTRWRKPEERGSGED